MERINLKETNLGNKVKAIRIKKKKSPQSSKYMCSSGSATAN